MLVGADSLTAPRSGVGRMTLEIVRAARASAEIGYTGLLLPGAVRPASILDRAADPLAVLAPRRTLVSHAKIAVGRIPGVQNLRALKNGNMNRQVRRALRDLPGAAVYHEPNMIARPVALPTVVTINDLSWHHQPSWHPADRLHWIDRNLPRTLAQARRFVAISRFTRDAAVAALGIDPALVDVVPLAPADTFRPASAADAAQTLARFDLRDRAYVFGVSTLEPRKNFDRLLAAHLHLPPALRRRAPLVIAGGRGWGEVLARPEADAAIRDGTVRLLGHVTDLELALLTARAAVFAYVSLYEGFGLPVIEAMAAGAPVLASATTAVGELAHGAALTVDPLDEADIGRGLQRLLEDAALADTLRAQSLARAADYTWDRTMAALVTTWRHAAG